MADEFNRRGLYPKLRQELAEKEAKIKALEKKFEQAEYRQADLVRIHEKQRIALIDEQRQRTYYREQLEAAKVREAQLEERVRSLSEELARLTGDALTRKETP